MHRKFLSILTAAAVAAALAACGGSGGSAPRAVSTPRVQYVVRSFNDAMLQSTDALAGRTDPTGIEASSILSLSYVETTAGSAGQFVGQHIADADADTTAWLFLEHGDFVQARHAGEKTAATGHTLWVLAIKGRGVSYGIGSDSLDIASLGQPVSVPAGVIASVDAKRLSAAGPAAAANTH